MLRRHHANAQLLLVDQLAAVEGGVHHAKLRMFRHQNAAGDIAAVVAVAVQAERQVVKIRVLFNNFLNGTGFYDLIRHLLLFPVAPLVRHLNRLHVQRLGDSIAVCKRVAQYGILRTLHVFKIYRLARCLVDLFRNGDQLVLRIDLAADMGDLSARLQPFHQFS